MKAFLLAAGNGTRLGPLTENIPKCLMPIAGVPILGIWLELCRRHGILRSKKRNGHPDQISRRTDMVGKRRNDCCQPRMGIERRCVLDSLRGRLDQYQLAGTIGFPYGSPESSYARGLP